jgi:hypothetical protein
MTVRIEKTDFTHGDELECPICKTEYLHQGKVEVFDRSEDEFGAHIRTVAGNGRTMMDRDMTMNPSPRRQGLRVHFECESGCRPVLNMFQHKGTTYLNWDEVCGYEELKDAL